MFRVSHAERFFNTIAYEIVLASFICPRPSTLWPASAPMPLEPLHCQFLQQMIPAALFCRQTSIGYQLTHPDGRDTKDFSGFFRSEEFHHTQSCTTCGQIKQPFSACDTSFGSKPCIRRRPTWWQNDPNQHHETAPSFCPQSFCQQQTRALRWQHPDGSTRDNWHNHQGQNNKSSFDIPRSMILPERQLTCHREEVREFPRPGKTGSDGWWC